MIRPLFRTSALVFFAAVGSASAADLPVNPPIAPLVATWTGFYAGANAGYAWSNGGSIDVTTANVSSIAGLNGNIGSAVAMQGTGSVPLGNNGFAGGGQAGYNQQFDWVVLGFEADIEWLAKGNNQGVFTNAGLVPGAAAISSTGIATATAISSSGTLTASRSIDYFGTVRARIGVLPTPILFSYLTGGLAYAQVSSGAAITETLGFLDTPAPFGTGGSFSDLRSGWTVGSGLEWMFAPCWSAKAEYLYYDLGHTTHTLASMQQFGNNGALLETVSASQFTTRFIGNTARIGINYHFGDPLLGRLD